jgi:hypothetical protein
LPNLRIAKHDSQNYFWRTKEQKEIDFIEEYNGKISASEFMGYYEVKF